MTLIVHTFLLNRDTNPTVGLQGMFETVRYSKTRKNAVHLALCQIYTKERYGPKWCIVCLETTKGTFVNEAEKAASHRDYELGAIFENRIMAATTHVMGCEK